MGTHPIFESDFDCLIDWPVAPPPTSRAGQFARLLAFYFSFRPAFRACRRQNASPTVYYARVTRPLSLPTSRARRAFWQFATRSTRLALTETSVSSDRLEWIWD